MGYTFPKSAAIKEEYSRGSGKENARLVQGRAEAEGRSPFSHRTAADAPVIGQRAQGNQSLGQAF